MCSWGLPGPSSKNPHSFFPLTMSGDSWLEHYGLDWHQVHQYNRLKPALENIQSPSLKFCTQKLKMALLKTENTTCSLKQLLNSGVGWIQKFWWRVLLSTATTKRFQFAAALIRSSDRLQHWQLQLRLMGIVVFTVCPVKYDRLIKGTGTVRQFGTYAYPLSCRVFD